MTIAKFDVSELDDISFTHDQHPKDDPTFRLDMYQDDATIGSLRLSREQAIELRATLNDWASFYGVVERGHRTPSKTAATPPS